MLVIIIICLSIDAFRLTKIILVVVFAFVGMIFLFFQLSSLYATFSPSLEEQLYSAVRDKCSQQSSCQVHLHELTSFKWDKAYFFSGFSHYTNQDIKKITGIEGDFQRNENLTIFLYHGKLVEYGFSDLPEEVGAVGRPSKDHYFNMFFSVDQLILREMKYVGPFKDFKGHTQADYYEITPQNDLLYVWFITLGDYYYGYSTQSWASHTNATQAYLFDRD